MVKLGANSDYSEIHSTNDAMSIVLASAVLVSIVVTLFYGIKFKWFRYRMTFPSADREENPVMLRAHSVTEIRENCSTGVYRSKSMLDDNLPITNDNEFQSAESRSPSSYNIKLNSSSRESIFRWPFRNKMTLSRQHSRDENSSRVSSYSSSRKEYERREQDAILAEKNERIRRSIFQRLNSNSMSMPDLVQCDVPQKNLTIQKGVEEVLDEAAQYQTVDEIREIKSVPKVSVKTNVENPKELKTEISSEMNDEEIEILPRPPTPPLRRRSRTNSLKPVEPIEDSQDLAVNKPPMVIPRKKNVNYNSEKVHIKPIDQTDTSAVGKISVQDEEASKLTPKSILKSQAHSAQPHQTRTNVHFVNVPDSSDEEENDNDDDIWRRIDIHREKLSNKSIDFENPPPLPKTPPPSADLSQRNFEFA